MANSKIVMKNQFGEESINTVLTGGTNVPAVTPIANGTVVANVSGVSAQAAAVAVQTISDKLPAKTGVTAIAALSTPVTAITIALSTGDTYTDAAVNSAVNGALTTVVADLQLLVTKANAILAALKVTT